MKFSLRALSKYPVVNSTELTVQYQDLARARMLADIEPDRTSLNGAQFQANIGSIFNVQSNPKASDKNVLKR